MHGPEIGRLIREETPVTPPKLEKLLNACEAPEDRTLLVHAAVRDFVGEAQYSLLTGPETATSTATVQESLGGPIFRAHFPIHPRAEQVLRYVLERLQRDPDVEQALILLGKFLELPEPLEAPAPGTKNAFIQSLEASAAAAARQIDAASRKTRPGTDERAAG